MASFAKGKRDGFPESLTNNAAKRSLLYVLSTWEESVTNLPVSEHPPQVAPLLVKPDISLKPPGEPGTSHQAVLGWSGRSPAHLMGLVLTLESSSQGLSQGVV